MQIYKIQNKQKVQIMQKLLNCIMGAEGVGSVAVEEGVCVWLGGGDCVAVCSDTAAHARRVFRSVQEQRGGRPSAPPLQSLQGLRHLRGRL